MAYVNLGQVVYPIGAIFASISSTSPSSMFGGTWSQINGDACLMGGNAVGYVGSKTISIAQMPAHTHSALTKQAEIPGGDWYNYPYEWCGSLDHSENKYRKYVESTGGGQNYLPYSYRCYMWRRTA